MCRVDCVIILNVTAGMRAMSHPRLVLHINSLTCPLVMCQRNNIFHVVIVSIVSYQRLIAEVIIFIFVCCTVYADSSNN